MDAHGFAHFAQLDPSAPAITDTQGRRWSRGDLFEMLNQIAHGLRERGLREGDAVAILAPNCLEFVAAYLAVTSIGLYAVPINWHLAAPEVTHLLESSRAKALFAHAKLAPLVQRLFQTGLEEHAPVRVAFGEIPGFTPLDDLIRGQPRTRPAEAVMGRLMMYTSATTGRPKAIGLPIVGAEEALAKTIAFHRSCGVELESGNVHLCASMLYHSGPLEFVAIALHMGHHVILVERWDPGQLLELIHTHRVTTSFMVPAMFVRLMKLPAATREKYDVSSLRLVAHSAAPCPVETKQRLLEWWGPVIWESYGAAEGVGTVVSPQDWLRKPGTVGRAIPGSKLRILDDEGRELPAGETGSIYLSRYTGERFEYRDDPEKTRAAYRDDVFTVGDVGYMDDDGYLYICDRKIDMIICGGMNIYSAEVEQCLLQHPAVLDCAVFGVPDELMGEAVHAVIQPATGVVTDAKLSTEIIAFLRQQLSTAKIPRRIEYVEALPRDPNGKLYKRVLREKWREAQAARR